MTIDGKPWGQQLRKMSANIVKEKLPISYWVFLCWRIAFCRACVVAYDIWYILIGNYRWQVSDNRWYLFTTSIEVSFLNYHHETVQSSDYQVVRSAYRWISSNWNYLKPLRQTWDSNRRLIRSSRLFFMHNYCRNVRCWLKANQIYMIDESLPFKLEWDE
jgi:hypothetical protein